MFANEQFTHLLKLFWVHSLYCATCADLFGTLTKFFCYNSTELASLSPCSVLCGDGMVLDLTLNFMKLMGK
jgi:hypothetical protein